MMQQWLTLRPLFLDFDAFDISRDGLGSYRRKRLTVIAEHTIRPIEIDPRHADYEKLGSFAGLYLFLGALVPTLDKRSRPVYVVSLIAQAIKVGIRSSSGS